jgi:hypothetical protein
MVTTLLVLAGLLATASAAPQSAAAYGPQPTADAAFAAYVSVLRNRVKDPALGVYSPATQRLMQGRPITDAQQAAELGEIDAVYASRVVREQGTLAVVTFPGSTRVPPYFFRRGDAGWTIDLASTARIIGFDRMNRWFVRDRNTEFAFGL